MQALRDRRMVLVCGVVLSLVLTFTASTVAQGLGEIARQERERAKDQPQRETYIYTNDDLKKSHILVPEDQVRALAARTRNGFTPDQGVQASELPLATPPTAIPALPQLLAGGTMSVTSFPASTSSLAEVQSADLPSDRPKPHSPLRATTKNVTPQVMTSVSAGWKIVSFGSVIRETHRVRIEPGDSLWKLAQQYLGNGKMWRKLAGVNPQLLDPNLISVGDWILLPPEGTRRAAQVIVQPGDSLWSVAHLAFGNGSVFTCIAAANPQVLSVDRIRPGETLVMPETCAQAR